MPLYGDQVTLKNGDRLTGKVLKKDGAKLTFKSDLAGEVTIDWTAVSALNAVQGPVATAQDTLQIKTQSGTQTAPLGEVSAVRNPAEQKAYERLLHPHVADLWAGYVDLGFAIARGNARSTARFSAMFISK